jgi:hypothetical protein
VKLPEGKSYLKLEKNCDCWGSFDGSRWHSMAMAIRDEHGKLLTLRQANVAMENPPMIFPLPATEKKIR